MMRLLAKSPRSCPPAPSATAHKPISARSSTASSFRRRTVPTWVRAAERQGMFLKPSFLRFLLDLQPAGEVIENARLPLHFDQRSPADIPGNLSRLVEAVLEHRNRTHRRAVKPFLQIFFGSVLGCADSEIFGMEGARGEAIGCRGSRLYRRDRSRWRRRGGGRHRLPLALEDGPRGFTSQARQGGRRDFGAIDQIDLRQAGILLKFAPGSGRLRANYPVYGPRFHAETEQHELDFADQRGSNLEVFGLAGHLGGALARGPQWHWQDHDGQCKNHAPQHLPPVHCRTPTRPQSLRSVRIEERPALPFIGDMGGQY